jgi:hypothetical protein
LQVKLDRADLRAPAGNDLATKGAAAALIHDAVARGYGDDDPR